MLEDETEIYADGTVASVRVLSVPPSDRIPDGIMYAFHYGETGTAAPRIRFDNHHGPDELYVGDDRYGLAGRGLVELYEAWRAALPSEKRIDW